MNILVFAGSLRKDSFNKKFAREAARVLEESGHKTEFLDLKDYPMPVYDGDIEAAEGLPENTKKLSAKLKEADAIVISVPEYNYSIAGPFKNVIDWVSRDRPVAIAGKHILLLATSIGPFGGIRGLWQTRIPLEGLGAYVFPGMMPLAFGDKAFDEDGKLKEERSQGELAKLLKQFTDHAAKA